MAELDIKEIERLRKLLLPVFQATKTKRVYLFGSLSKGTATRKSDIDLMIEADTQKRFFKRYADFEKIQRILSDRSVDMLIYTTDELSKISHRTFIKSILEKGVILYER
jgi:predicted nucleotidyltransferase